MGTQRQVPNAKVQRQHGAALASLTLVSVFFCFAYGLANRLTASRDDVGTAVFAWERAIPFIEWTIVPYLSLVGFFFAAFFLCRDREELRRHVARVLAVLAISLACFALWPLRFTFERPPVEGLFGVLFEALYLADLPYNRAPSLHVSMVVILWAVYEPRVRGALRLAVAAWFALIAISVLTTYQHHVIDVPAGLLAGWLCVRLFPPASRQHAARPASPRLSVRPGCSAARGA